MFRLPKTSFGLLFVILVLLAGGVDLLTRPKARPPADLIGHWSGPHRTLEIEADGIVNSATRNGNVRSETGGRFLGLANDTLSYRVFFVPAHLKIDRGPVQDSVGWALWVEGEELRRDTR